MEGGGGGGMNKRSNFISFLDPVVDYAHFCWNWPYKLQPWKPYKYHGIMHSLLQ